MKGRWKTKGVYELGTCGEVKSGSVLLDNPVVAPLVYADARVDTGYEGSSAVDCPFISTVVEPWFVFSGTLKFNLHHQKWFFKTQLEFFDGGWMIRDSWALL